VCRSAVGSDWAGMPSSSRVTGNGSPGWLLPSGIVIIQQPLFGSVGAIWHGLRLGVVLELLLNRMQFRRQQVGRSS